MALLLRHVQIHQANMWKQSEVEITRRSQGVEAERSRDLKVWKQSEVEITRGGSRAK